MTAKQLIKKAKNILWSSVWYDSKVNQIYLWELHSRYIQNNENIYYIGNL